MSQVPVAQNLVSIDEITPVCQIVDDLANVFKDDIQIEPNRKVYRLFACFGVAVASHRPGTRPTHVPLHYFGDDLLSCLRRTAILILQRVVAAGHFSPGGRYERHGINFFWR